MIDDNSQCVCLNLTFILYNEIYVILYKSAYILVCLDRSVLLQCACAYTHSEHPLVLGCDWMVCTVLWRMHYLLLPSYLVIHNMLLTLYTYYTATDVLGKSKNKTLTTSPNDRTNNHKQSNQSSKNVRFSTRDEDIKSTSTPTHKAKLTKPISKSNP